MSTWTSALWGPVITLVTLASIAGLAWFTWYQSKGGSGPGERPETMGHVWDEDLAELNNPLPAWWRNLFYITLGFGLLYLLLYPGLGGFRAMLGWTQLTQYQREVAAAEKRYGPLFEKYANVDIATAARSPGALKLGRRLYASYCTACHGSDARGVRGFPNLADRDWLWGGEPGSIELSILDGRNGIMPAWKTALGGVEGVRNVTQYVMSLSGRKVDPTQAEAGKASFEQLCIACHLSDGRGNPALGAPNLTDGIWLYGGSERDIAQSISEGRQGEMPGHREFLGEAKVHLLTAYIYSLSNP